MHSKLILTLLASVIVTACIDPAAPGSASAGATPGAATPGIETGPPRPGNGTPNDGGGGGGGGAPAQVDPPINDIKSSCQVGNMRIEMLAAVNAQRSQPRNCGGESMPAVAPLRWNSILEKVADAHSRDMAANNYFSHNSLDGRSPFDRMGAAGYRIASAGENIAAGTPTVASAVAGWMNSPGHCKNIMGASYTEIGAGCAVGGSYGSYFTQNFGSRF